MPLDAICLAALVAELRPVLEGGKIDKIYQPSREEILLAVRGGGENVKLLLSASPNGPRLHFTKEVRENPAAPPMFCMLLRKHLAGGRILAVEQPEGERIVLLRVEIVDELGDKAPRTLVLEALGRKGNIILLDAQERILDCVRRVEGDLATGSRAVMPGRFYRLPDPRPGLAPLIRRELEFRGAATVEEMTGGAYAPCMLLKEGKKSDFTFLPILQYGPAVETRRYESFSALLDDFYAQRETAERVGQRGQELYKSVKRVRDRVERRVGQQKIELQATADRERKRELGDLLTSNLHLLTKGMTKATVADYYHPDGEAVEIPLDPLLTPQQNAARYYKEYNKAKTAQQVLTAQIEKGEGELDYLDSVLEAVALAEGERDLMEIRQELTDTGYLRRPAKAAKRMKVSAKPMEFRSTAGLRISVGKNNTQNDLLTTKQAGRGDLWLHTQKIHGSHVVLWCEGKELDSKSVEEAAILAAYFSQARDGKKVPVDYTPVKYVKKPGGARPGTVVYTTCQTAYVDPDGELAKKLRVR